MLVFSGFSVVSLCVEVSVVVVVDVVVVDVAIFVYELIHSIKQDTFVNAAT